MTEYYEESYGDIDPRRQLEIEDMPANLHFATPLISLELQDEVLYKTETIIKMSEDGKSLLVGYLSPDCDPMPHEFEEGESLVQHVSAEARDADFMDKQERGLHPMIVERYQHSGVDFSISNTKSYPDRQWDVVPCGVYTPCSYVANLIDKKEIEPSEVIRQANVALNIFSEYCNGSTYNCNVEVFDYDEPGDVWVQSDVHTIGTIGYDSAKSELKELADGLGVDFGVSEPDIAKRKSIGIETSGPSF